MYVSQTTQNLVISHCYCAEDGIAIVLLVLFSKDPVTSAVAVFLTSPFSQFVRYKRHHLHYLAQKILSEHNEILPNGSSET